MTDCAEREVRMIGRRRERKGEREKIRGKKRGETGKQTKWYVFTR